MAMTGTRPTQHRQRGQGKGSGAEPSVEQGHPQNARCQPLSREVVGLVRDVLVREAKRKRGQGLGPNEIQTVTDGLLERMDQPQFQAYFKRSKEQCSELVRRNEEAAHRDRVLERVLVKRFAYLFPDTQDRNPENVYLYRSCLPGLLEGIRLMVGSEYLEACQGRARFRFQELPGRTPGERWELAYDDEQLQRLVLDLIVHLAPAFRDVEYRFDWITNLVERHMPSHEGGPPPFGRAHFFAWLRALFNEPFTLLESDAGREWLEERYGEGLVDALSGLHRRMVS